MNTVNFDGYVATQTGPTTGTLVAGAATYELDNVYRKGKVVYANTPGKLWFHPRIEFDLSEADVVRVVVSGAGPQNRDQKYSVDAATYAQAVTFSEGYKDQA